ncbi:hypothetical protein [Oceanimonas smirnovii]|uniref:hypothetical protein n=1 Tax=Oceanimonas smirnovii TaxID=264574 RepID=UPI003FD05A8C
MKLNKRMTVNGKEVHLVNDKWMLELSSAGRGIVTIKDSAPPKALVHFDMGYGTTMHRWFTGIVTRAEPADNGHTRLLMKELSFVLGTRTTMSIQHATIRQVITELAEQTGLTFALPEADYVDTAIPNFTTAGTGAQLLENASRAFQIPEFCWYQQPDGNIYVGSYQHSRWPSRPLTLDAELTDHQAAGNSLTLPVIPLMRPGALVNGQRITHLEFDGADMTLRWQGKQKTAQQRQIEQDFPELAAGFHLPVFGVVTAATDAASAGQVNDPFRPRYAVDVQQLDEHGQPDMAVPVFKAVPVPVLFGGPEQGHFQYPVEGTLVEMGWAFGRPDKPFIRTILGTGWHLPDIQPGEQLQQQRAEVYQRTDPAGNHTLETDQTIRYLAAQLIQQADDYQGEFGSQHTTVTQHSTEEIAGRKLIEALGAIELLAGDDLTLASLANLQQVAAGERVDVTGADYQHSIGSNSTTTITGDSLLTIQGNKTMTVNGDDAQTVQGNSTTTVTGNAQRTTQGNTTEQTTGTHKSTASTQVIQGNSIVLGNGTHNMLALMISMMANVQAALQKLDGHTHTEAGPPNVQGQVATHANAIGNIKSNLQSFTG